MRWPGDGLDSIWYASVRFAFDRIGPVRIGLFVGHGPCEAKGSIKLFIISCLPRSFSFVFSAFWLDSIRFDSN